MMNRIIVVELFDETPHPSSKNTITILVDTCQR